MTLNRAQFATLITAAIILVCLNASEIWWDIRKGTQHPVGTDIVSVFVRDSKSSAPAIPVLEWADSRSRDTGQSVSVYVKNNYRDDDVKRTPRLTLAVMAAMVSVFAALSLLPKNSGKGRLRSA